MEMTIMIEAMQMQEITQGDRVKTIIIREETEINGEGPIEIRLE